MNGSDDEIVAALASSPGDPPSTDLFTVVAAGARRRRQRRVAFVAVAAAALAIVAAAVPVALRGGASSPPVRPAAASPDRYHTGTQCRADQLRWVLQWATKGMGLEGTLSATNTSGHDCDLLVKPRLAPLDSAGKPLDVQWIFTDELVIGPAVLRDGATATSRVVWAGWCGAPAGPQVRVTLPDGSAANVTVSGQTTPACPAPGQPSNGTSSWFGPLSLPASEPTPAPPPSSPPNSSLGSPPVASVPVLPPQPASPEALAAGSGGSVYIADRGVDVIYRRSAAGVFTIVAGTGTRGYSGDGGLAASAEIYEPHGMIAESDGTLLFADTGNNRVRAISPGGVISTVAGDGRSGVVTSAGPASSQPLDQPQDVDLDPAGGYDITTSTQLLHVDNQGRLTVVAGNNPETGFVGIGGPALTGSVDAPNGVAVDSSGGIFVAGFATKALLYVTPTGTLTAPDQDFYPRGAGGLRRSPDGSIVAMNSEQIVRYRGTAPTVVFDFLPSSTAAPGAGFQPNGLAVAPNGDIWVSTITGNGWANQSALARIDTSGHETIVWRGPTS